MNEEAVRMPLIGDRAPEFKAKTTQGEINFPKDFEGRWVVFFSHPADFTPVCTTEFMTFASMQADFAKQNCKLLGLSIDSIYAHIAWLRTIKERIVYKDMNTLICKLTMFFSRPRPRRKLCFLLFLSHVCISNEESNMQSAAHPPLLKFLYLGTNSQI